MGEYFLTCDETVSSCFSTISLLSFRTSFVRTCEFTSDMIGHNNITSTLRVYDQFLVMWPQNFPFRALDFSAQQLHCNIATLATLQQPIATLPQWLRPTLQHCNSYGQCHDNLHRNGMECHECHRCCISIIYGALYIIFVALYIIFGAFYLYAVLFTSYSVLLSLYLKITNLTYAHAQCAWRNSFRFFSLNYLSFLDYSCFLRLSQCLGCWKKRR